MVPPAWTHGACSMQTTSWLAVSRQATGGASAIPSPRPRQALLPLLFSRNVARGAFSGVPRTRVSGCIDLQLGRG
jgi:hypothetical protein